MGNILHYPGDCSDAVENCNYPLGPDTAGGYWIPIKAIYDGEKTTVQMKPGKFVDLLNILIERGSCVIKEPPEWMRSI